MMDTSKPNDSEPDDEVTDPKDVDPTDGTDKNNLPVDNPAG